MKRNALALHEWKDLYNKGLIPDTDLECVDNLESLALDMIHQKDAEEGESWSNDSESIAKIMVEFYKRVNENV
jgi:hypothetical protein